MYFKKKMCVHFKQKKIKKKMLKVILVISSTKKNVIL